MISKLKAFLLGIFFTVAGIANASPVEVSYTVGGSANAWLLNFTVTNNLGGTNGIYFFDVAAPSTFIVDSPFGWGYSAPNTPFNVFGITYNNPWCLNAPGCSTEFRLENGETLDGFKMVYASEAAPTSIPFIVFASGGTYDGPGNILSQDNPGVLGFASVSAVPEPETYALMLAGLGLVGAFTRRRKAKQA